MACRIFSSMLPIWWQHGIAYPSWELTKILGPDDLELRDLSLPVFRKHAL